MVEHFPKILAMEESHPHRTVYIFFSIRSRKIQGLFYNVVSSFLLAESIFNGSQLGCEKLLPLCNVCSANVAEEIVDHQTTELHESKRDFP